MGTAYEIERGEDTAKVYVQSCMNSEGDILYRFTAGSTELYIKPGIDSKIVMQREGTDADYALFVLWKEGEEPKYTTLSRLRGEVVELSEEDVQYLVVTALTELGVLEDDPTEIRFAEAFVFMQNFTPDYETSLIPFVQHILNLEPSL